MGIVKTIVFAVMGLIAAVFGVRHSDYEWRRIVLGLTLLAGVVALAALVRRAQRG